VKLIIYSFLAIILSILLPNLASAQDTTYQKGLYKIFGGYSIYWHNPDFKRMPGVPNCCPQFNKEESGNGYYFGVAYELPLKNDFYIGLRTSYDYFDGDFQVDEPTTVRIGNEAVNGFYTHYMSTKFSMINFEPYLKYKISGDFNLFGGGFIAPYISKEYSQYEKIKSPKNGVFTGTGTNIRNKTSGDIVTSSSAVYTGLNIGISYDLPLNSDKSLILSPEIYYNFGLTDLIDSGSWKANNLKFGFSIAYSPRPKEIIPVKNYTIFKIDTITVSKSDYQYDTFVKGKQDTITIKEDLKVRIVNNTIISRKDTLFLKKIFIVNIQTSVPKINIKTKLVTQAFQNLDVVFFDRNSDKLQSNYNLISSSSQFDIERLEPIPIKLHNDILNIIGYKLTKYPDSKITLKGFIDSVTETGNTALAYSRAKTIRKYFNDVWKIDSNRISIKYDKNCYPALKTITQNDSGYAENRRVQILSSNPDILAPLKRENFEEIVDISPREFKIGTKGTDKKGINQWHIIGKQANTEVFNFSGNQLPDELNNAISDNLAIKLNSKIPIDVQFSVIAENGSRAFAQDSISIIKDTSDIKVSRLALILFEIASDQIPVCSEKEIKNFLKELKPSSELKITGYSDILGTEEFNKNLSKSRANKTSELIKRLAPNAKIISINGVGSDEFPPGINSYNTAAERFFSRTVLIEIIDRIK
jgi:outer membrane protein OmpA-like peptidoglycan-associated protein